MAPSLPRAQSRHPDSPGARMLGAFVLLGLAVLPDSRLLAAPPIAWERIAGGRVAPAEAPGPGRVGFTRLDAGATGVVFTNSLRVDRYVTNQIYLNGSGVALGDVNGDGWCDLYLCGVDGRNALYLNRGGWQFEEAAQRTGTSGPAGGSTGAAFADLEGDGDLDLVLACEWDSLRVFENNHGAFAEIRSRLGLESFKGWWNGVTTGDFDGDGRLDLVASNWGLNTQYRARPEQPRQIYYGDFDRNGTVDLIEAYGEAAGGRAVPDRDFTSLSLALPRARARCPTYEAYGLASVADLLGDALKTAGRREITTLASMVFLNRGPRFEAHPLPDEAQWAPAFAVSVGDLDGDGQEDVFLSQNFFATQPQTSRADAGRGLVLQGDGRGGFTPMSGRDSGVAVYGEQRGAALADYDHDGRLDLAVSQNGAASCLFRNEGARPGLRVRVQGPTGNPTGVGVCLGLVFGARRGPIREIHAGSGYGSQDAAVQVLAIPEAPSALWMRGSDGRTREVRLPEGCREVVVNASGEIQSAR